jgi:hypothetical protein
MSGDSDELSGFEGEPEEEQTLKMAVIRRLYELRKSDLGRLILNSDIQEAIEFTKVDLSKSNPANFLKDIIRSRKANAWWPAELRRARVTARQRYGQKRVMQFIRYRDDQDVPFPDRFGPTELTPTYEIQSASIPFLARSLGRKEETWLTQIVVNLRIIETHLSLFSPLSSRLRDVTHLQMGMKTQPEIDATFVVTLGTSTDDTESEETNLLVTCEAKQNDERLLEDQIREQVAKAFDTTAHLHSPAIHGIKPMAALVLTQGESEGVERLIYVVEFGEIMRGEYELQWRNVKKRKGVEADNERVYNLPLNQVAGAFFRVVPAVRGINDLSKPRAKPKSRSRK